MAPEAKVECEEIEAILPEVLKRDALEGEQALRAQKQVHRHAARALRKARQASEDEQEDAEAPVTASATPPKSSGPQPKPTE